jgi:hypothetical protein
VDQHVLQIEVEDVHTSYHENGRCAEDTYKAATAWPLVLQKKDVTSYVKKYQLSSPSSRLHRMLSFYPLIPDLKDFQLRKVSRPPVQLLLQRQSKLVQAHCMKASHLRKNRRPLPNQPRWPKRINSCSYLLPRRSEEMGQ